MLAIRLQRTGRTGHAQFRLIVQDSRFSPTSGRVVAQLGSYNPHTKQTQFDKDKASEYLAQGAQPSDRAAKLLKAEGVKLPAWYKPPVKKKRSVRQPDKYAKDKPAPPAAETGTTTQPPESNDQPVTETEPAAEAAPAEPAAETTPTEPTEAEATTTKPQPTTETADEAGAEPAEPAEAPEK